MQSSTCDSAEEKTLKEEGYVEKINIELTKDESIRNLYSRKRKSGIMEIIRKMIVKLTEGE